MTSSSLWPICAKPSVSDPGCRGFSVTVGEVVIEGILVQFRGRWYAYCNMCPHTGINLNWQPDQFFDLDHRYLQCSMHGALFEPATGLCIYGPCQGQHLQSLPLIVGESMLYLEWPKQADD